MRKLAKDPNILKRKKNFILKTKILVAQEFCGNQLHFVTPCTPKAGASRVKNIIKSSN